MPSRFTWGAERGLTRLPGKEILATVPCDESFADVIAGGHPVVPRDKRIRTASSCKRSLFHSRGDSGTRFVAVVQLLRAVGQRELKNSTPRTATRTRYESNS